MHNNSTQNLWRRPMQTDVRFASATGRVRVLEEQMLTDEDFRLLADSRISFSQRRDILAKAGYTGDGSTEQIILAARDEQDILLKQLSGRSGLATVLLLDLDYHNVKAMVRHLLLEQHEQSDAATGLAAAEKFNHEDGERIPHNLRPLIRRTAPTAPEAVFDVLVDLMRGSGVAAAPSGIRPLFFEHIKQIVHISGTGSDLAATDLLADRLCFTEMVALAEEPSLAALREFLLDYISIMADMANLETFLRVRRTRAGKSFLEKALVPGGRVKPEQLAALYGRSRQDVTELFQKSYVSDVIYPVPKYQSREDIRNLGLMKDELLLRVSVLGKKATAGGAAILGYWLAKRLEMKNIRLILQAVGRGVKEEDILPMIRPAYKGYRL